MFLTAPFGLLVCLMRVADVAPLSTAYISEEIYVAAFGGVSPKSARGDARRSVTQLSNKREVRGAPNATSKIVSVAARGPAIQDDIRSSSISDVLINFGRLLTWRRGSATPVTEKQPVSGSARSAKRNNTSLPFNLRTNDVGRKQPTGQLQYLTLGMDDPTLTVNRSSSSNSQILGRSSEPGAMNGFVQFVIGALLALLLAGLLIATCSEDNDVHGQKRQAAQDNGGGVVIVPATPDFYKRSQLERPISLPVLVPPTSPNFSPERNRFQQSLNNMIARNNVVSAESSGARTASTVIHVPRHGTWAAAYEQSSSEQRKALELLFLCNIIPPEVFPDGDVSDEHVDECVWIAMHMLQRKSFEEWVSEWRHAQRTFDESVVACFEARTGAMSRSESISVSNSVSPTPRSDANVYSASERGVIDCRSHVSGASASCPPSFPTSPGFFPRGEQSRGSDMPRTLAPSNESWSGHPSPPVPHMGEPHTEIKTERPGSIRQQLERLRERNQTKLMDQVLGSGRSDQVACGSGREELIVRCEELASGTEEQRTPRSLLRVMRGLEPRSDLRDVLPIQKLARHDSWPDGRALTTIDDVSIASRGVRRVTSDSSASNSVITGTSQADATPNRTPTGSRRIPPV